MYILSALRTQADTTFPTTFTDKQNLQDQAIAQMIDACHWRIRRLTFADLAVDGATQRWFIPGEDCNVVPREYQIQPLGLGTARVGGPAAAPTVSASGSGSTWTPGVVLCMIAYVTASGESGASPPFALTVLNAQNVVFAAVVPPTAFIPITSIQYYVTDPDDFIWKDGGTQSVVAGTAAAKTLTAPGTTPAAGKPFISYIEHTDVSWQYSAAGDVVAVEDQVKANGQPVVPGVDAAGCTVSATSAPALSGNAVFTRLWYECRVPIVDFTVASSPIYAPDDFARKATLGYYAQILSERQAGGDLRNYAGSAQRYLTEAQAIYKAATPRVLPASMRIRAPFS